MNRLSDLRFLFRVVAGLELIYAAVAVLTPPSQVENVTGWVLTADGQWLTKLLGLALLSQAWVAWVLRDQPHLGVAWALAFYQLASATADWVMWIWLADDGIFSNGGAVVVAAIITHYALGLLLVRAIRGAAAATARSSEPASRPA
ncbi:MAG TPA: hypothetical protein VFU54_05690 [Actinomycetota bacterium]|jgi:hypothetical protein|nr:hypothetical protein [Actinomycetes bacterium]HEU4397315.1 hypothetical protein [Actinomycetota bacterium]